MLCTGRDPTDYFAHYFRSGHTVNTSTQFPNTEPHRTYVLLRFNPVHQALELAYSTYPSLDHPWYRECHTNPAEDTESWLEWILYSDDLRIQYLDSQPLSHLVWSDHVHRLGPNYLAHRLGITEVQLNFVDQRSLAWLRQEHSDIVQQLNSKYRSKIIQRYRSLKHRDKQDHNAAITHSLIVERHHSVLEARRARGRYQ